MDLRKISCEGVEWIQLAYGAFMNMMMKLQGFSLLVE
jgi:hypothetical protein